MDLVLETCDQLFLDSVYGSLVPASYFAPPVALNGSYTASQSAWSQLLTYFPHPPLPSDLLAVSPILTSSTVSAWPRDYIPRQLLSLTVVTFIGFQILYFVTAGFSYKFIFNHEMMKHPRFLKNQVQQEIVCSVKAFPLMTLLTIPWFQGEVMGYSLLYNDIEEYGWIYFFLSIPAFLVFTDFAIYWIHRLEHHPLIYKIHKPHHKWIIPTPYSAYAFHPLDGYAQSIPYHLFVYLFPLQRHLNLALFLMVNVWTVFIHDSDMVTGHWLETVINGPAHHTLHHLYFTVNYGQYFTWADKLGNSYRQPHSSLDPMLEVKTLQMAKEAKASGKTL